MRKNQESPLFLKQDFQVSEANLMSTGSRKLRKLERFKASKQIEQRYLVQKEKLRN